MELSTEFYRALAFSWLCFAAGAGIFHAYRWCQYGKVLSRLLLALSPGILSAYGFHSVQVCNTILAAKIQGENVSGRVYLTSITKTDLGDGVRIEREQYSDGQRSVHISMPNGTQPVKGAFAGAESNAPTTSGTGGSAIRLREWRADGGDPFASFSAGGGTGLGEPF
jgi:hypothetical protein